MTVGFKRKQLKRIYLFHICFQKQNDIYIDLIGINMVHYNLDKRKEQLI